MIVPFLVRCVIDCVFMFYYFLLWVLYYLLPFSFMLLPLLLVILVLKVVKDPHTSTPTGPSGPGGQIMVTDDTTKDSETQTDQDQIQKIDKNADFEVVNVLPKKLFDESDLLDKEFRIAEGHFLRMSAGTNQNYKIKSIDIVFNRDLREKFKKKQMELTDHGRGDCLLLFHGTPQRNIESILKNNFNLFIIANGRKYGDGVYFSECPEVSLEYTGDQKSLILCNVLVDNSIKLVKAGKNDSRCWTIVVPEVNQILPRYVINFTGGRRS